MDRAGEPDTDREWSIEVIEARPNNAFGHVLYVTMSRRRLSNTLGACHRASP